MKLHFMRVSAPLVCALAWSVPPALAQSADQAAAVPAPAAPATPTIAGWGELVDSLRDLPAQMLARLPESMQRDPQVQQEVGRLMLEALASSALDAIGGDGDHPSFMPTIGQTLNVGQPNADTVYLMARLTPGGTYRLRGQRGSLRIAVIGQVGPNMGEVGTKSTHVGAINSYDDLNSLHVDRRGRFDVLLSPVRPAGYQGDWWPLDPSANRLLLRLVNSDWGRERDPTIAIERVDAPATRPRASAADLEQRLRRLPKATAAIATLFVGHVEALRQEGYVNRLKVLDVSQQGGLTGQFYYEGAYDLGDDEALLVEAKVPARCVYRSVVLTNDLYETTDWYDNHSSLNGSQARPDKDSVLRVVVSARDPGVPNWLDTAGYPQGLIQGRWTYCSEHPIPTVRKLSLDEVRRNLPPETGTVTPEQRDREIRARRSLLQQRSLW